MSNNQILRSLFTSCQNVVLDGDSDSSRVTQLLCDRKSSGELIGVLSASILNKFLLTLITFGVKVPAGERKLERSLDLRKGLKPQTMDKKDLGSAIVQAYSFLL
mmetsp:Transcript_3329/g.15741  ORF Transcript_3329/g.15741 Transcript_3329/m.15741 type:complete len:104 (-) Transcript_3329:2466-2777(-)